METEKVKTENITKTPLQLVMAREADTFEAEIQRLKRGEIPEEDFKAFRLQHGIYGQRQKGVQMVRIKIPFGGLTSEQMVRIAEVSEEFADGISHITTRQDIQLHWVPLEQIPQVMRSLGEVGITTREACGNTVRNVTACHLAGVCPTEAFDVTPYAKAVSRYLLRNPVCQNLPRKFKIALSGCQKDCALTPIHDIGLIAVKRQIGDQETLGFKFYVGGGLGSSPRVAQLLNDFVPVEDLLATCEAVIRVFNQRGNRKNRNRARIKFLIEKLGMAEFRRLFEVEYNAIQAKGKIPLDLSAIPDSESPPTPGLNRLPLSHENGHFGSTYEKWLRTNVLPQRQAGYVSVIVKLPLGDLTAGQLKELAKIARDFAGGSIRTTIQQNIVLRWVHEQDLKALYLALLKIALADGGAERLGDVTCCPGSDTCNLGVTSSIGLSRVLTESLIRNNTADLDGFRIKISGCQNSCGQHHIAAIGFHGVSKKINGHLAPHYEMHLGGQIHGNGGAAIARATLKIPAKQVPEAVQHLVGLYRNDKREGETFVDFVERLGRDRIKEVLAPYTQVPSFEEAPEFYFDWESESEFNLEDMGAGECAGSASEMLQSGLAEANRSLEHALLFLEKGQLSDAMTKSYRAAVTAAKTLLVTEGVDPLSDQETLEEFKKRIIPKRGGFSSFVELVDHLTHLSPVDVEAHIVQKQLGEARRFVEECQTSLSEMRTSAGEAPKSPEMETAEKKSEPSPQVRHEELDLRGVACPFNFVRTKLKLEEMESGEKLAVLLDEGEPIQNVPRSVRDEGHRIVEQTKIDEQHYRVVIEKDALSEQAAPSTPSIKEKLDLKGVGCPFNYVRTKLKLEEMESGELLEIVIDDGEPYRNVPRSVRDDGHKILEEEKVGEHYRLVIQKGEE
jgi:sulfite reductase (ferredoxin)